VYYAIVATDRADSLALRLQHRPEHLARLETLREAGRLLRAGPFPAIDSESPGDAGFSGSLIVASFESLQAAQDWAAVDPFVREGIYATVDVRPFKRVLP
jgi:hypothetical protein